MQFVDGPQFPFWLCLQFRYGWYGPSFTRLQLLDGPSVTETGELGSMPFLGMFPGIVPKRAQEFPFVSLVKVECERTLSYRSFLGNIYRKRSQIRGCLLRGSFSGKSWKRSRQWAKKVQIWRKKSADLYPTSQLAMHAGSLARQASASRPGMQLASWLASQHASQGIMEALRIFKAH